MKVDDLMIGDWVYYKGKIQMPCRILTINGQSAKFDNGTPQDWMTEIKNFTPIPLTAEILEKNGLELRSCFDNSISLFSVYFKEDENYKLELSEDDGRIYWSINCDEYHIIELKYVHELQHALRLCGIDKEIEL